ncbi:MAG: hypothetical protein ACON5F_08735 [Jejuia sp.]
MLSKTLKQVVLLFMISIAVFSCDENNNEPLDTSGDLIGDWELIGYTSNGNTSATIQGTNFTTTFTGKALNIDYILTFSENPNKAITENGSFDYEIMTSINGFSDTETTTISNIDSEANWTRNGNVLSFTGDFGSFETNAQVLDEDIDANPDYIIEELTITSLILTTSVSDQITDLGIDYDFDMNLRLEFTRI